MKSIHSNGYTHLDTYLYKTIENNNDNKKMKRLRKSEREKREYVRLLVSAMPPLPEMIAKATSNINAT